jgi:hypothetical protein
MFTPVREIHGPFKAIWLYLRCVGEALKLAETPKNTEKIGIKGYFFSVGSSFPGIECLNDRK